MAVALGFLVLTFSSMEPLQRFGYLTSITMVISAVGALTIFPVLSIITKAKFITGNNN